MRRIGVGRLSTQYQVTLVLPVREFLDVGIGDYVIFVENGDGSLVVKKAEVVEAPAGCASS